MPSPVRAAFAALAPLVLMVALSPQPLRAQQPSAPPAAAAPASLAGVVGDSIRGGPLAGALVSVEGSARTATTNAQGVFRIDGIAPGKYSIVVTHALLDTLGLKIRSAPFTIAAGQRMQVGLQTPSAADLRDELCPTGGLARGPGMLIGRVNKADSDEPAAGAAVSLVFKDLYMTSNPERVRTGRADATGLFAICGLPNRITGTVQASLAGVKTGDLPVALNNENLATAILSIGVAVAKGAAGPATATVKGVVKTKNGSPVGGAQVSVTGTSALATTADDGSFALGGLPAGTQEVVVRKIGFAQASQAVALTSREPSSVTVTLDAAQALKEVKVVGKLDGGLSKIGFTDRQLSASGYFVTPADIDKRVPIVTTDMLRAVAGLRVVNGLHGTTLQAMRGPSSTSDGCINIFIDHARFQQMSDGDLDNAITVDDLGAMEFYASASVTPPEFSVTGQSCATLVVWSKTLLARQKP